MAYSKRSRQLNPSRAVSTALSRLRSEVAHGAVVAQVVPHYVSEDAGSAPVYHAEIRQTVADGVIEELVQVYLRVRRALAAQV